MADIPPATVKRIGFIGLGNMGLPMANNLYKGFKDSADFIVFDVNQTVTSNFLKEHNTDPANPDKVKIAKSPLEVAKEATVVVTMLPASQHVQSVYFGQDGLLEGLTDKHVVVDASTIDQSVAKKVADVLHAKGVKALDAPVSGGTGGAQAGTLTFMVGSRTTEDFDLAKPYLEKMGKNIVYCGTNGNGQVAKICNNMLLGISMIATSETMNLGVRMGMDPKLLAGILNTSSGRCWSSEVYNPCPGVLENSAASRGYTGGFGTPLMAKDMRLAVNAAVETRSTVLLGALAQQLYNQMANNKEFEKLDFSAAYKWLSEGSK
ncbi:hypothetical protein DFQ27_007090 [Actinomortierella ambigua]|uniref:3-hydroxyisobutyrate dehydrogenase n=1 Tax=Actinomortierella ambigua TaxID=1343610 RepID=A0A9P6PX75_9FUNG|nr:hypothetical protein DFQ27_007090 [Actinomortierella ambigua]